MAYMRILQPEVLYLKDDSGRPGSAMKNTV